MNKDLGVWTYQDCALVLIDYQKESHRLVFRRSPDADRRSRRVTSSDRA